MTVFGDGAFREVKLNEVVRMGPKSDKAGVLISITRALSLSIFLTSAQRKGHMKMQREGDCPQARKRGFTWNRISCHLDLRLLASRTVRKEMSVV